MAVGIPIAVAFDLNSVKFDLYKNGINPRDEVGYKIIQETKVQFTFNELDLEKVKFNIVAVSTLVNI